MGLWRLLNCLIQKLGSHVRSMGDIQLAALAMLTLSSSTVRVLPLHLVDLLQFSLLVLDPLGILIVFDLLFQDNLPEPLHFSYVWWLFNLNGLLSRFPVESFGILPEHLILLVLPTSLAVMSQSLWLWFVVSASGLPCMLSVVNLSLSCVSSRMVLSFLLILFIVFPFVYSVMMDMSLLSWSICLLSLCCHW